MQAERRTVTHTRHEWVLSSPCHGDELDKAMDAARYALLRRTAMIVDLFAGPGGWDEGLRSLGVTDVVGIELDAAACATRAAAGHRTIRADVATYPAERFTGWVTGLIASPPCQSFSLAGQGEGRDVLPELAAAIRAGDWDRCGRDGGWGHMLDVGAWIDTARPRWVACEQVPPVLPLWEAYADRLRDAGWWAWAGLLNAADYGVPQTRVRAFLLAHRDRPVQPPEPTHARHPQPSLFGPGLRAWVSMADALGWPDTWDQPAPTLAFGHDSATWAWHRPATTVAGDPRITARCHHDAGTQGANAKTTSQVQAGDYYGTEPIRLTITEALVLQSFPADYPVQGNKTKQFEQVGNAVPPLLAAHVLSAVTGRPLARPAEGSAA